MCRGAVRACGLGFLPLFLSQFPEPVRSRCQLANLIRDVSRCFEPFGKRDLCKRQGTFVVILYPEALLVPAGQCPGPGGDALRSGHVTAGEACPFASDCVSVGGRRCLSAP